METAQLIIDPPLSGPVNMARDEALLASCSDHSQPPILRFYRWSPATISLGYFQTLDEFLALPIPAGDLDVVRRTTGGGAILHDVEVTYSLTLPITHALVDGRPNELYSLAHNAIIEAIGPPTRQFGCGQSACGASAHRGPFFCFGRRHALDVVIPDESDPSGTRKIAGSAQRRTQTAILQHGSIMLDSKYDQQPLASWAEVCALQSTQLGHGTASNQGTVDGQARTGKVDFDVAVERLTQAFAAALHVKFEVSDWTESTLKLAAQYESRYSGIAWTRDRERVPI